MSDVYYRILRDDDNVLHVVCLQDFDEKDYDQSRFVFNRRFGSEEEAMEVVNGMNIWLANVVMKMRFA